MGGGWEGRREGGMEGESEGRMERGNEAWREAGKHGELGFTSITLTWSTFVMFVT